ncbi:glycogen/starch/alpha-glucan phosphorylase [Microvirga subterranea]|uniref:Alpha-1,4 glucan phosphorylase n=1 Tax=Microvirga subterranea TaxID=186651 RepID=A0A370HWB6_9HYPH|nr:glycogen/starch/alpha-glucan phosphorylase [Microvirga subterranea]RDI61244.1 starch phosphorylase [Microvirga subterranea]
MFEFERGTGSRSEAGHPEGSAIVTLAKAGYPSFQTVDAATFRNQIMAKLVYQVGQSPETATDHDWFMATAYAVKERVVDVWNLSTKENEPSGAGRKKVCYLSMEFLIGRLLSEIIGNLGLTSTVEEALAGLGISLDSLRTFETDAALGNGGLGRLAACFMESMATTDVPAVGYGIRYDYGIFKQSFRSGWQQEAPDDWMAGGNPWEFERSHLVYPVRFGGYVQTRTDSAGHVYHTWCPDETVLAVAHDTPVVGWRGKRVNTLRLWAARAEQPLRLQLFNAGDHVGAQTARARAEAISNVLYPSDASPAGHELRLRQEYFFTSASLQDLLHGHLREHGSLASLPEHAAIQLNDTHPALAVAELMRLLVDEHGFDWDEAWRITTGTLNYTNHTLMPEALETWPVALLEQVLPRHMQIIYLINWLHLEGLSKAGRLDPGRLASISLIDENNGRHVRMGHLAFIGSRKVNGVSALHTDLLKKTVFRDLHEIFPDRIVNKTNGITVRRWFHEANPGLKRLVVSTLGERVLDDIDMLVELETLADDPSFQRKFAAVRLQNKLNLADIIRRRLDVTVDPTALFDIQVKRIHEYKRQLLNVLETIALYQAIKANPNRNWVPRVKVFAGKAAPSYVKAKLIIKLANDVARMVNSDPVIGDRLKVAFLPNYNVSLAEAIIPAADLSEQISTAGMEASGTGNMKFALNGALTIGTLDGANVEISEHIGRENMFIFGLTTEQVEERRRSGGDARDALSTSSRLKGVLAALSEGMISPDDCDRYRGLIEALVSHDPYMIIDDFGAYWTAQRSVDELWLNQSEWWRRSILSTARMSWFSSDRTIRDYVQEIWHA